MIKININPDTNNFVNCNFPLPLYNVTAGFYKKDVPITGFLTECIYIPRIQNRVIPLDTEQVTIIYYIQQFVETTQH
jgi:hypothetical protein